MTQEELIVAGAMHMMHELDDLKRLEAQLEMERAKVAMCLKNCLVRIGKVKGDLARLVANEALELRQVDAMCDVIRKMNYILDCDQNRKAGCV